MGKTKKDSINVEVIAEPKSAAKEVKGVKCSECGANMTPRGPDTLVCPKCKRWMPNPTYKESIEEKKARLQAEIAALG